MLIDLGCGNQKPEGYIGVDISPNSDADVIHDCEQGLPFEDNSADEIRAFDFLEHIHSGKVIYLMNEIWRVLKPNGKLVFSVPDAEKGQGAFQDPTHKSFWVKNSFKYYDNEYYKNLYGINANFKIEKLESVEYDNEYWGKIWGLRGELIAVKTGGVNTNVIYTTDDIWPSNLQYWEFWDKIKEKHPELKVIAFVVAEYNGEDISKNQEFNRWYEVRKDWVEIGIHGLDHQKPQLGWLPKEQQKYEIERAMSILNPYLPQNPLIRFPGFRMMPYSESIVRELGITGIAYQGRIKYFKTGEIIKTIDTHCCDNDNCVNSISKIWKKFL